MKKINYEFNITKTDSNLYTSLDKLAYLEPIKFIKNVLGGGLSYYIAEAYEQRDILRKVREIESYYNEPWPIRKNKAVAELVKTLNFCKSKVPYYSETFRKINFEPEKLFKDIKYFTDVPYLTKDIIRDRAHELLSRDLSSSAYVKCKTGGSTGGSCYIYYDQSAVDYAAAVVQYARRSIDKRFYDSELHFACKFPGQGPRAWPNKEDFKCFVMNRSNIFFDRLDDVGLTDILKILEQRKPYLVHGHPSTIFALSNYLKYRGEKKKYFSYFESSGELLTDNMRSTIEEFLQCNTVNRYGLAELGVVAYELGGKKNGLLALDSEAWIETKPDSHPSEILLTSFRNKLMPLIRYESGDIGITKETPKGLIIDKIVGRIHDFIIIDNKKFATHYIQDILDHVVGGIQNFQIDVRGEKPKLLMALESNREICDILTILNNIFGDKLDYEIVKSENFINVGRHSKFRYVID